ncbi:MAG: hypothetical protein PHO02_00345 [Candidatus Nanoarchaeia archaeon]|nr:hypothetical protein [Candidatus Nanoarchaeia archaeon]
MKARIISSVAVAGLATLAAAGLDCARDLPLYGQSSNVLTQNGAEVISGDIYWNEEQLELAVRVVNNGNLESETVWRRQEYAESTGCVRITLDVFQSDAQINHQYFSDEGCDRTFEHGPAGPLSPLFTCGLRCSFDLEEPGAEEQAQAFRNSAYDSYMQTITSTFDVERLIAEWHQAKEKL